MPPLAAPRGPVLLALTGMSLVPAADARPKKPTVEGAAACPVVEPVQVDRDRPGVAWLVRAGDRVFGKTEVGLVAWSARGGEPVERWTEEVYPHWGWVPGGDRLVNAVSGRGLGPGGTVVEGALPEDQRFEDGDDVGRGPDFVALGRYGEPGAAIYTASGRQDVAWTGEGWPKVVALGPDGGAWLGSEEWVLHLGPDGTEELRIKAAPISIEGLAVAPDGRSVAAMAYEGMVNLLDAETGVARWSWPADRGQLAFAPDGAHLLVANHDGADVVEAETGCLVARVPARGAAIWMDADRLAWVDEAGALVVREVTR